MPIKPENRSKYPHNWEAISRYIRKVRAGDRCECYGECGEDHFNAWIDKNKPIADYQNIRVSERCKAQNGQPHPTTGSKVVLTVAHLDHDPTNNNHSNLKAMCQLCHNRYDREHRNETRKKKNG